MGAKVARSDKLCINFWDDAAIGFTGMDIETCVRVRIPTLSILFNNFHMAMGTTAMGLSQRKFGAMDISGDYASMARVLGLYSERGADLEEIAGALGPTIAQSTQRRFHVDTPDRGHFPAGLRRR